MKETIDSLITDIETWLVKIDETMPKLKIEIEKRIAELKLSREILSLNIGKEKSYVSSKLSKHEISPEHLIRIGREVIRWQQ